MISLKTTTTTVMLGDVSNFCFRFGHQLGVVAKGVARDIDLIVQIHEQTIRVREQLTKSADVHVSWMNELNALHMYLAQS